MALTRIDKGDAVWWVAEMNGVAKIYVTKDKDLVLHEEGIADGTFVGVRLVDDDGTLVAAQWQPAGL